jgi:hypothetical protein
MFTEDLTAFLNPAEFATSVSVGGVLVSAIYDNGYALGNVGGFGMASTQPTLTLATANVPASPEGQAAVVNGVAYVVASHEPDGTGVSRLLLEKA